MTAQLVDELTDTRSSKTRECIGQGTAQIVTGLFGGMGGCAVIGQTMINVKVSGARTRLSTFLAGAFLLVLVVGFGPGQVEKGVEVGADDRRLGASAGHLLEPLDLFKRPLFGLFGHIFVGHALFEVFDFRERLFAAAEFFLDGLHLLAQVVLALIASICCFTRAEICFSVSKRSRSRDNRP